MHSMRKNEHPYLRGTGTESETNADFTNAFECRVSEKPVETDGRERERECSENREKKTEQTLASPGFAHAICHRTRIEHRQRGIDRRDGVVNRALKQRGGHGRSYQEREACSLGLP